jgi:hypothetical protein
MYYNVVYLILSGCAILTDVYAGTIHHQRANLDLTAAQWFRVPNLGRKLAVKFCDLSQRLVEKLN